MDVRKWLEATADRAPPDASSDIKAQDAAPPIQRHPQRLFHHYRLERKEASSDSSIIVPSRRKHRPCPTPSLHTASPTRDQHACSAESRSRTSHGSRILDSDVHREHNRKYERRPRRKTRPDRYEHKPKRQKRERELRKEQAPTRRRSNRTNDGSRTTGLVQSFQLKNGPKNNRLTLKADANVGLFKHGRASAQMSGKGRGLPDLAFNELRFLRKPKEHQDDVQQTQAPRQSKKNERRRHLDEQMSTYFTARRQTPNSKPYDQRKHFGQERKRVVSEDETIRQQEMRGSEKVEDFADKYSLQMGGKRAGHDTSGMQSDATSYLPWSESVTRQVSNLGARQDNRSSRRSDNGRSWLSQHRRSMQIHAVSSARVQRTTTGGDRDGMEHGQWVSSRRVKRSTLASVYPALRASKATWGPRKTSSTRSTSQSLPRAAVKLNEDDENREACPISQAQNDCIYRTSDILKVTQDRGCATSAKQQSCTRSGIISSDKENNDPESSFSLDKLLDGLKRVKAVPAILVEPASEEKSHQTPTLCKSNRSVDHQDRPEPGQARRELPEVRQWRRPLEQSHVFEQRQCRPSIRVAQQIYPREAGAEIDKWGNHRHPGYTSAAEPTSARAQSSHLIEENGMFDVPADDEPSFTYINDTEQVANDEMYPEGRFTQLDIIGDDAMFPEQERFLQWPEGPLEADEPQPLARHWNVGEVDGESNAAQRSGWNEQPAGFWKPHRLY